MSPRGPRRGEPQVRAYVWDVFQHARHQVDGLSIGALGPEELGAIFAPGLVKTEVRADRHRQTRGPRAMGNAPLWTTAAA